MLDAVAQRYSQLPSTVRESDALNFRVVALLQAAGHFDEPPKPEPAGPPTPEIPMEALG